MEHFTLDYPPDLEDWLDLRAPYWNASLAGCLFGQHEHVDLSTAIVQKITGYRDPETAAMRRGTAMEPYIIQKARDELGLRIEKPELLYGHGPLLATLDGEIDDDRHLEAKSTTSHFTGELSRYWYWQAQAQMGCRGTRTTIFAILDRSLEVQFADCDFDENAYAEVLRRAEAVMSYVALGEVPPDVILKDADWLTLYPEDDGTAITVPDPHAALDALLEYREAKVDEKQAVERSKLARAKLLVWLQGSSVAMAEGMELYSFKQPRPSRRFDMRTFEVEHPDLIEQYTTEQPNARRIYVHQGNINKLAGALWPEEEAEEIL